MWEQVGEEGEWNAWFHKGVETFFRKTTISIILFCFFFGRKLCVANSLLNLITIHYHSEEVRLSQQAQCGTLGFLWSRASLLRNLYAK